MEFIGLYIFLGVIYILSGIVLSNVCASIAKEKGYESKPYFLLGLFFNAFALVAACALPDKVASEEIFEQLQKLNGSISTLMDYIANSEEDTQEEYAPQPTQYKAQPTYTQPTQTYTQPQPTQYRPGYASPRPEPSRPASQPTQYRGEPTSQPRQYGQTAQPAQPTQPMRSQPQNNTSPSYTGMFSSSFLNAQQPQSAPQQESAPAATEKNEGTILLNNKKTTCSRCGGAVNLMDSRCPHCGAKFVMSPTSGGLGYVKKLD